MPRKPTGNPTGRPKGQGPLGQDIQRLTIRLPAELYTRLEAFAEGRSFTRGTPELGGCARQLLEYALDSLHKRQSLSIPLSAVNGIRQPESHTPDQKEPLQQPVSVPPVPLATADVDAMRTQRRALLLSAVPWETDKPEGISPTDLRTATGIKKNDVTNDLDQFCKDKQVEKVGKGLYVRPVTTATTEGE